MTGHARTLTYPAEGLGAPKDRHLGPLVDSGLPADVEVFSADDQFHFLFQYVLGFGFETSAKPCHLVFSQSDPDFAHRIDGGELAQCVNQNRRPAQLGELFRRRRLLLALGAYRHGSHASSKARSRDNNDNLHSGMHGIQVRTTEFKSVESPR